MNNQAEFRLLFGLALLGLVVSLILTVIGCGHDTVTNSPGVAGDEPVVRVSSQVDSGADATIVRPPPAVRPLPLVPLPPMPQYPWAGCARHRKAQGHGKGLVQSCK